MVRNPSPCSSSLEAGIIPPSEPSPHWLVSRLAFSFRLGPWYRGYSFLGVAGLFPGVFWLFIESLVMAGRRTGLKRQMGRIYQIIYGSSIQQFFQTVSVFTSTTVQSIFAETESNNGLNQKITNSTAIKVGWIERDNNNVGIF